ncbi:hypothetical protein [Streptomyces sp. NPDC047061]|uniref:hypothetical protein n=1 Tax=Streptomyces sp. NPDC047061 TaxID=3154605 RepID=UPI0033ECBD9D
MTSSDRVSARFVELPDTRPETARAGGHSMYGQGQARDGIVLDPHGILGRGHGRWESS